MEVCKPIIQAYVRGSSPGHASPYQEMPWRSSLTCFIIVGELTQKLIIPIPMLRRVDLPESLSNAGFGRLFLSAMPGRYSPLEESVDELNREDVKLILCLVHDEEIAKKSPRYRAALDGKQIPAEVAQFPIRDFGVPGDPQAFVSALKRVLSRCRSGESWVIHCGAGHGRTGIAAIVLLWLAGLDSEKAQSIVERAGSGPDTEKQQEFLRALFRSFGDQQP